MELNTHACLLRGRSGKVTAIKRLDLEVYKLEEVKSNGEKKEKKTFLIRLKAQSAECFWKKILQAMIAATSSDTVCDERLYAGAQNGRLLTSGLTHKTKTQVKHLNYI